MNNRRSMVFRRTTIIGALCFVRGLFDPVSVDEQDRAISFVWVGDEEELICFDPNSARILGHMWNDGYGKFYPTIYAPLWSVYGLLSQASVVSISLRSFPRVALELIRIKSDSMTEACRELEDEMVELNLIPRTTLTTDKQTDA